MGVFPLPSEFVNVAGLLCSAQPLQQFGSPGECRPDEAGERIRQADEGIVLILAHTSDLLGVDVEFA